MKKLLFFPVMFLAAVACTEDDRDDLRREVDQAEPDVDCRARCSEARKECVSACDDDNECVTGCTDQARECEVDCE